MTQNKSERSLTTHRGFLKSKHLKIMLYGFLSLLRVIKFLIPLKGQDAPRPGFVPTDHVQEPGALYRQPGTWFQEPEIEEMEQEQDTGLGLEQDTGLGKKVIEF